MRKEIKRTVLIACIVVGLSNPGFSQEESDCSVLKIELIGEYKGECKKSKAHGKGFAKGIDEYEGYFKKGMPHGYGEYKSSNGDIYKGEFKNGLFHGNGLYIWANGNIFEGKFLFNVKNGIGKLTQANGKILTGKWYKDKYVGEVIENVNAYKILTKSNIKDVRISKSPSASPDKIEVVFKRTGRIYKEMDGLRLAGSSGSIVTSLTYTAFENIMVPFEGKIEFIAPNEFYTANHNCYLTFKINEKSSWLIEIIF